MTGSIDLPKQLIFRLIIKEDFVYKTFVNLANPPSKLSGS